MLGGTESPSDPLAMEQMVMDTSPDINMQYRKRVPEKEAGGKEKMWGPSIML